MGEPFFCENQAVFSVRLGKNANAEQNGSNKFRV
jgi:hypothetical protein